MADGKNPSRVSECGSYVYLALKNGREAIMDAHLYDSIKHHRWHLRKAKWRDGVYVGASVKEDGKQKTLLLHRVLLGIVGQPKAMVDHINHDGLDNRLVNLRLCTNAENQLNTRARLGSASRYKGVAWNREKEKWVVTIQADQRKIHLGQYTDEVAAAVIHNVAAALYHGDFANLNRVPGARALVRDILALRQSRDEARAVAARRDAAAERDGDELAKLRAVAEAAEAYNLGRYPSVVAGQEAIRVALRAAGYLKETT